MILITATYSGYPVYFWGTDDLSEGFADESIIDIFERAFTHGTEPWPQFFTNKCSNLVTYPNINSLADAQHLFPELFL